MIGGRLWDESRRVLPSRTFEADARPKQQTRMPQSPSRRHSLAAFHLHLYHERKVFLLFYPYPLTSLSRASTECVIHLGNACVRPGPDIRLKKLCACDDRPCGRQYQYRLFKNVNGLQI